MTTPDMMVYRWQVDETTRGRLDHFVAGRDVEMSRSQVARAVSKGRVSVNGELATKAGHRLRAGDLVVLCVPPPEVLTVEPQDISLTIVYEDPVLVVVCKQSGLVVHPAHGHPDGTLVNALLHHCPDLGAIGGVIRPGIVHRIDQHTSGLLVVAKTAGAHRDLSAQIKAHTAVRRYLAIARGPTLADSGTFDTRFNRHPRDRKRFSSKVRHGKHAVTHYRVIDRSETCALVDIGLETGRTHQIRVHFSEHGHGLIGDPVYGRGLPVRLRRSCPHEYNAVATLKRQALHAYRLTFVHPETRQELTCWSPPPADFRMVATALFGAEAMDDLVGEQRVTIGDGAAP